MVIKKSKKAWTKVIEVFIALLLIMGVLMIVVEKGDNKNNEIPKIIHDVEISILRDIEYNVTLRQDILDENNLPVEWGDFPQDVKNKILEKTLNNLNCSAMICQFNDNCIFNVQEKEIYTQEVFISSTLEEYNPRKLKLFCWRVN